MNEAFKEEYPHLRSDEEVYFQWYIDDLTEAGFIDKVNYEEETYTIFEPLKLSWHEQKKTKVSIKEFSALAKSTYNPDWNIYWTQKAKGVFVDGIPSKVKPFFAGSEFLDFFDQPKSVIDVKGSAGQRSKNASEHTFPFKQKLMWVQFQIYVHKVRIDELFSKTFTPYRYTFTDKSGKKRKLKWEVKSVYDFEKEMRDSHQIDEDYNKDSFLPLF